MNADTAGCRTLKHSQSFTALLQCCKHALYGQRKHECFARCFGSNLLCLIGGVGERKIENTNLAKNAALLTKEVSSAKSISSEHDLSVKWMLTRGIPSDSSGCGTKNGRVDLSCLDFVL